MSHRSNWSRRETLRTGAIVSGGLLSGASAAGIAVAKEKRNFRTHLSGDEEVDAVETDAQGQATFQLDKAGDELRYRLIVANIDDVSMAHIHSAPAGSNGPAVAWLYPEGGSSPELIPGRFDGVLAEATLTADDLVGPLDGGTMNDLVALLRAGGAYVNVHTEAHPGGEVRGQIR
ncbi:CHRD domain-containing protein [Haloplanus aerogenes]|uniref:CHRD domain-containing protein n=1 Tax=Haloplanus aerogenes TaxID=660522 RepID=A0A3M0CZ76_9EURY|nr:CHRD domain-containing protein [Haloplanus aerogenes]AZH25152.1 CHRD domain-containing protein [Haloplanus aerogenes]RMB13620.1 CHRD domain-containing protein [Haloplanus aerogenes]